MENLTEENKKEGVTDFSGNYIEKFQDKNVEEFFSGALVTWEKQEDAFLFHGELASLEIRVIAADILKFRHGISGYFEDDFSYSIDPSFQPEELNYKFEDQKATFVIKTDILKCYISKTTLQTKIVTLDGTAVLEDEKGFHWQDHKHYGGHISICTRVLHEGEKFYGLGDKTGNLNLIGTKRELWGTDCYGYGNESDPVYKNIPFYMGQHSQVGYGIFMDNTFRSFFDFGKERKTVCSYWSQGGEMRYYYIHGPKLIDVVSKYARLTGKPQLPPKWALGYHQSKWSYYPESVVRKLGDEFRSREIPCDVIHLDIDYMDEFRCFTWDDKKFPNPKKMISDLKNQGFKTVVIIDPGIKIDKNYRVYQEGMKGNHFCQRMDGDLLKASVWPGLCHFPDFTQKKTREWWATLFDGLIENGVDGVWNDMNEPATFEDGTFPNDVRHDFDGHPGSHRKGHNVYGSLMAQSTWAGQKQYMKNKRPFTISRSAYAGIQKYASVWTGDNMASWEHLKIANIQCQRLAASGISFAGSDVGGFIGSPDGELYTRWIQMAVFHPFFRTHSSGDHGDKEPWKFDQKYVDIVRRFIEMRYELMPYIYSVFQNHSETGIPMIRSLHLEGHIDPETFYREEEFFLGDHLMVCPVSEPGKSSRRMYLTSGQWYNYWSDQLIDGGLEIKVDTPLNQIPIFIRQGAIIPKQPKMQYVDEFVFDELTLECYKPASSTASYIYEDSGDGYDYLESKGFVKKQLTSAIEGNYWLISQVLDGEFASTYQTYEIRLHGLQQMPSQVVVDNEDVTTNAKLESGIVSLSIDKNFKQLIIKQ
ncbi:alpha-glucosidase [Reichenbachiella faecimaris]|uniref:Alpha-glucosidase n=1 Tax=Reichenbachiella faecimaris TaxID=692418 RepID=A0A1W2GB85_REIFA|nr:glycoside hydrolase family 31 protein [Reichenbachiella faecimaris]SMD33732.1 alpha-glucosidase [Reichenbachiella faecimaris]